jgi:hypothetical protein
MDEVPSLSGFCHNAGGTSAGFSALDEGPPFFDKFSEDIPVPYPF